MQFFLLKHGESRLIEIKEADKDKDDGEEGTKVELDVPVANGEVGEDDESEEQRQEDADVLQQLVDNFVDETKGDEEQTRKKMNTKNLTNTE